MGGLHSVTRQDKHAGDADGALRIGWSTETSPLITQIRNNVIVSITPVADPDGRDRNVDWYYKGLEEQDNAPAPAAPGAGVPVGGRGGLGGRWRARRHMAAACWGKYVFHDNNRDINLLATIVDALARRLQYLHRASADHARPARQGAAADFTPISGGPPQNPNLDPILFAELPFFSNFELEQMTKYGIPGVYTHAFMDGWSPGYLGSVA